MHQRTTYGRSRLGINKKKCWILEDIEVTRWMETVGDCRPVGRPCSFPPPYPAVPSFSPQVDLDTHNNVTFTSLKKSLKSFEKV